MKHAKIMMLLCTVTLTPFSFVKLLKKTIDELHIESAPGKPFVKSTTQQPPHPLPPSTTSLQKRWIGPRTLKTAPRALSVYQAILESKENKIWKQKKNTEMKRIIRRYNLNLSYAKNAI